MRSSSSLFKLSNPIPSSGWNVRSSPYQWDSELKAIDWSLAQLCTPEFSILLASQSEMTNQNNIEISTDISMNDANLSGTTTSNNRFPTMIEAIANRIISSSNNQSNSTSNINNNINNASVLNIHLSNEIIAVASDFASLIGLYFIIWIRFGVSRIPIEHVLETASTKPPQNLNNELTSFSSIRGIFYPNIGDYLVFKKSLYFPLVQLLKVRLFISIRLSD